METATRHVLSIKCVSSDPTTRIQGEMQRRIMHDPSVMAHWNYLLSKVEAFEADESDKLLGEIVDKWIKIRGHSFASGWVEQYELANKQSTKRKDLENLCKKLVNLISLFQCILVLL